MSTQVESYKQLHSKSGVNNGDSRMTEQSSHKNSSQEVSATIIDDAEFNEDEARHRSSKKLIGLVVLVIAILVISALSIVFFLYQTRDDEFIITDDTETIEEPSLVISTDD